MEEFLNSLGIAGKFNKKKDGSAVLDLMDSNEYGKIYSKLDKSDLVEEDPDASSITYESSNISFSNDEYIITLVGDFDADIYKVVVRER